MDAVTVRVALMVAITFRRSRFVSAWGVSSRRACLVRSCRHGGRLSWHFTQPQAAIRRDKTTRTRVPRRASMSISVLVLNRSMRPRRRSLIGVLTRPCTRRRLAQ